MRVFLAATMSGMSLKLRDDTVKKCKPLYFLETFYNGEKTCLKVMGDVGNDNFLLDSGAFSYMKDISSLSSRIISDIILRLMLTIYLVWIWLSIGGP